MVYVDDIVIGSSSQQAADKFSVCLSTWINQLPFIYKLRIGLSNISLALLVNHLLVGGPKSNLLLLTALLKLNIVLWLLLVVNLFGYFLYCRIVVFPMFLLFCFAVTISLHYI
ncbi:PREDICTED: uncharacterized protein LOC18613185 [Theobroma cacao]|uniref:Uncharacterized protein LOC18613185 n=1 Tax=Theobroma cacao TaxID=3641 RepID=A0AB32VTG2_THECC|nr:PREDICTED: uncharacterized protein LOC18613185 [Theobroma cacao]